VTHIHDDSILEILRGGGSDAQRDHMHQCAQCTRRLDQWQEIVTDLREVEAVPLDDAERHWLQALFRARGPVSQDCGEWVARLLRATATADAAIRGAAAGLSEHEAGPYQLTLNVRTEGARYSVHGQVLADDDRDLIGEAILSDDIGQVLPAPIDSFGEFSHQDLAPGRYRATLHLSDSRIVVEDLVVGDDEAS